MELTDEAFAAAMPERPVHVYPALVSTEADALARARAGEPTGTVVVAGYQVTARGRGGLPWRLDPERDVGFSIVLRPDIPSSHEGWLYTTATNALAGVAGEEAVTVWPDEVHAGGRPWGAVVVQTDQAAFDWAVLSVRMQAGDAPAVAVASAVRAIERELGRPTDDVLDEARARCVTLGRQVAAILMPLGPNAVRVTGVADGLRDDGALVLATRSGQRLAVPPQNLARLDEAL